MSNRKLGAIGAAMLITATLATSPAAAVIVFTNKTGQAVNDFHIELTGTGGALQPANSNPWGMSVITGGNKSNWSGNAIANNGTLTVPGWNLVAAPNVLGNIKINTPNLQGLVVAQAYWTMNGVKVGVGFPTDVTAGVPEPASWAMLIAGFGLVGATLRKRRMAIA